MKMRRLCAYIMALLLAVSMPLTAVAEDWYLENGDISVNASESGQTVSQGTQSNIPDSAPVITQKDSTVSTSNSVTITAGENAAANVTLKDVKIDTSTTGGAAVEIKGGGDVTIELDGTNTVKSDRDHAGVEKTDENSSGSLTIKDDNEKSGTLIATGGNNAAGIGGDGIDSENAGMSSNITISGGTVVANGGTKGAGIGGGRGGHGSNITISGGNVTATGGEGGAGIGGGAYGAGSDIAISGGKVTAAGGNALKIENADAVEILAGAGIGGGGGGNGSNITISGGTVDATGADEKESIGDRVVGGAGIGAGSNGTSDNIKIEKDADVTARGGGKAADIGDGNYGSTEKQPNNVDTDGLYTTGSVNDVSGTKEPPKDNDNGQSSGGGQSSDGGSTGGSTGGSNSGSNSSSSPSHKTWTDVAADLGKITASDNKGNALGTVVWLNEEDTLKVTAPANNVLVTGNKADLLQLKEDGVKTINLQTNRVNVSVSNQVLDKITDSGGGFQLAADDTTVSLSSTDGNNQKTPGLTLTADKQPEKGKLQVNFRLSEFKEGAGDVRESLNTTLQVSTNAPEASLSYDRKFLNPLMNSEFGKLGLAVGNLLATVDGMLGAITTVNGSGSISIGNNTVNMNGIQFSANNSSGNSQLSQRIDEIMFQLRNPSQSGSSMMVTVNEKAAMASASLKVPRSALQSLIRQGVEETVVSVNGETTSFQNGDMLKQIQDSQLDSALVCLKPSAIGEVDAVAGMFDKGAITYQFAD